MRGLWTKYSRLLIACLARIKRHNRTVTALGSVYTLAALVMIDGGDFARLLDESGRVVYVRCAWVDVF